MNNFFIERLFFYVRVFEKYGRFNLCACICFE